MIQWKSQINSISVSVKLSLLFPFTVSVLGGRHGQNRNTGRLQLLLQEREGQATGTTRAHRGKDNVLQPMRQTQQDRQTKATSGTSHRSQMVRTWFCRRWNGWNSIACKEAIRATQMSHLGLTVGKILGPLVLKCDDLAESHVAYNDH